MFVKNIRYMSVALLALMFVGCGGSSKEIDKERGNGGEVIKVATYIELKPTDTEVVTSNSPTFSFVINTNDTAGSTLCDSRHEKKNKVQVKVIKIDAQTANASVVVDEVMFASNDCHFEVQFPSLTLAENVGYAWRVGESNEVENADTKWNSFVYSTISMGLEDTNPHACEKNMVQDWTFLGPKTSWQTTNTTNFTSNIPVNIVNTGHDDNGSATLVTPNNIIYQVLSIPIVQGKYYKLKFSLKHEGKADFQIKALAFNGNLDSLQPDTNTSIIAMSGTMTHHNNWVKISLNPWKANSDFTGLAIALINEQNQTVNALIDRVCLVEVSSAGCGEEVDISISVPDGFDMNDSNPVITHSRYELGSTQDVYPDYNTSTTSWYEDANSTDLECSAIGGSIDFTAGEQEAMDDILAQETGLEDDFDLIDDLNGSEPDINETNLTAITSHSDVKCTDKILDYSKPFSGRDVVYVHGLQQEALNGYKHHPPTFTGRWPNDMADFYKGGEYHNATEGYWENHIKKGLGSVSSPTNSYLIVTWSTNQHIYPAVNAILKQVQDARNGSNAGVVYSQNGQNRNQCFGDNGIVFVTHSTGGQIVSTMFGLLERNKNTVQSPFHISTELYDKIDAQVSFDAAFRGSPIAAAGLITNSFSVVTHLMGDGIRNLFGDVVVSGASSFDPYDTIMADLGLESYRSFYRDIMKDGTKPTLMLAGTLTGMPYDSSRTAAEVLIRGYNDGVLSSWSQTNHNIKRPKYSVKKRWLLKDLDAEKAKRMSMFRKGKIFFNPLKFRYYVDPYLSPSGMVQYNSVAFVDDRRSYLVNHYPIVQTSGNHFDNVDDIRLNGNSYYEPLEYLVNNWEESSVVRDSSLYSRGLLSAEFATLSKREIAKETWGFHFLKVTWVYKEIKLFGRAIGRLHVPKFTWHYYEFIKWQREYDLLKNARHKEGAEYMYEYILRP